MCMIYHLYNTFPRHLHAHQVSLPNIWKGLVNVTFPSPLQDLNGSLDKTKKVYFRTAPLSGEYISDFFPHSHHIKQGRIQDFGKGGGGGGGPGNC